MSSSGVNAGVALRRGEARMRCLRAIVRDTQRKLDDIETDVVTPGITQIDPDMSTCVQELGSLATRPPAVLVLGADCAARARLVNCLLGEFVLPVTQTMRRWRWIRIQYGGSKQVQLNLSNSEFELVEELESQKTAWSVMPEKDLQRSDPADLCTIMDIELPNPLLKEGLKIIILPDLDTTEDVLQQTGQTNEDFYNKRALILKQFTPICFYALNQTGKNIFKENFSPTQRLSKESWQSDEFWRTQNMYYMTRSQESVDSENNVSNSDVVGRMKSYGDLTKEPFVFSAQNCMDLQQVKELYPNLQTYFVLFSDSEPISLRHVELSDQSGGSTEPMLDSASNVENEVTESTENELPEADRVLKEPTNGNVIFRSSSIIDDKAPSIKDGAERLVEQNAFMEELIDQWKFLCYPLSKVDPKSYWMILDDDEILKNANSQSTINYNPPKITDRPISPSRTNVRRLHWDEEDASTEGRLVRNRTFFMSHVAKFIAEMVHNYLLDLCTRLSEIHIKLLQQFILTSFDMAREMQVVPKKIDYVAVHEQQLYTMIQERFSEGEKKEELVKIMQQVLQEMKEEINTMDWSVDDLPCHQDSNVIVSNSVFYQSSRTDLNQEYSINETPNDIEQAMSFDAHDFDDYDIVSSDEASVTSVPAQNTHSINVNSDRSDYSNSCMTRMDNESSINSSVFARLMDFGSVSKCNSNTQISIKQASLDVQKTVLMRLSRRISLRLVKFVDCLRNSYFGTLQRCLESLEAVCREELGGRTATEAMRRVLSVAREVDLQSCASFSVLRTLVEHMRRLFQRLRVGGGGLGGGACCVLSPVWRRDVAMHTLHTLSATRLARLISAQMLEKLAAAHDGYQTALTALATALECRLHHTEDVKLAIRKRYAPGFARLCLESTSMCDVLQYGMPELGREIGRGQYGVVYACKGGWAGHDPCAIKSVLPSDERHFNELAMEFFYTRSIPPHARIVRLWGSAVERHASGAPTVLLVTERKRRDLHCAVREADLPFSRRMRIALDIVEGIRYLHSLGLVHRDIKMKNVLLDADDRASLTDLGFCMPEALMSGSVVGTPVHMAPELLSGDYDGSVDVYAFGILFWYLCAGNVKLPTAFEMVLNKEQLWSRVRRGLRPERLPQFTDECWRLMESCWVSEPSKRALLGDVQPILEEILERSLLREETPFQPASLDSLDLRVAWRRGDSLDFSHSGPL